MLDNLKEFLEKDLERGLLVINENIRIARIVEENCDTIIIKFKDGFQEQAITLETNDINYILEVMLDEYKSFYMMIGRKQVYRIQEEKENEYKKRN